MDIARHSRCSRFAMASTVAESRPPPNKMTALILGLCYRAMSDISVYELLNRKRRGGALEPREVEIFIDRYTRGEIPDYQMSAMLMGIAINGMTASEMATLTQ